MKNTHPRILLTPTGVGGDGCAAEVTNGGGENGFIARRECAATTPPNFEDGLQLQIDRIRKEIGA